MAVEVTREQKLKIGKLVEMAAKYADRLMAYMKANDLDNEDGRIRIDVDMELEMLTSTVEFGTFAIPDKGLGYIRVTREKEGWGYDVSDKSSGEYKDIFKPLAVRETSEDGEESEETSDSGNLPDDSHCDSDPVVCGVSVNESMVDPG